MPIVVVMQHPTFTREVYEETVRRITGGRGRLTSSDDWPVEGLLVHSAGESESGYRVVDVWESMEAFQAFGETLGPMLADLGVAGTPDAYPADAFVSA